MTTALEQKVSTDFPAKLSELQQIINENFPRLWQPTETCLSVIATLLLKDLSNPTGLNLIGSPSGGKTTVLSFFYPSGNDDPKITFRTHNFTPRAFVSHMPQKERALAEVDLLPKIENKAMIVPELAPIFGKRKEDLVENLSILTAIFDGQGFESDSGMAGHRGYDRPILFSWLGATTPLSERIWHTMGKLGARWVFLDVEHGELGIEQLVDEVFGGSDYASKLGECRKAVRLFLLLLWQHFGGARAVIWEREKDDKQAYRTIAQLAQLMARMRAPVEIWTSKTADGEVVFQHSFPIRESEQRAMQVLYNIARGHALLNGRKHIEKEDTRLLYTIVLSTAPHDRKKLLNLMLQNGGQIDYSDVQGEFGCSRQHAYRIMEILRVVGVADIEQGDSEDVCSPQRKTAKLKLAFQKLLDTYLRHSDVTTHQSNTNMLSHETDIGSHISATNIPVESNSCRHGKAEWHGQVWYCYDCGLVSKDRQNWHT